MNLKQLLRSKLTENELALVRRSFDVIGSIAVIEIPKGLSRKQKLIAESILRSHKNIKTVVKKAGSHSGVFRVQKLRHLAGVKSKEAVYRENGVVIKLDIEKVYFSPRLSSERMRIARQVKKGESILVMFSGCAPFPIVISKMSEPRKITAVEINPLAHRYAEENIRLNKANSIQLIRGDVRRVVPGLREKFDRVLMPLPKGASPFLQYALRSVRRGGIVHYYDFLKEGDIPGGAIRKIDDACKKLKRSFKVISVTRCGQLSPRAYRVCVDFRIL